MSEYPDLGTSNAFLELAPDGETLLGEYQYQTEGSNFKPGSHGNMHPDWRDMIPHVQRFVADIPPHRLITSDDIRQILVNAHRYNSIDEPAFRHVHSSVPEKLRVLSTAGYTGYSGAGENSVVTAQGEHVQLTQSLKSDASDGVDIQVSCSHPDSKTTRIVWPICKIAREGKSKGGDTVTQRSEASAGAEVDGSVGTASAMPGPVRE